MIGSQVPEENLKPVVKKYSDATFSIENKNGRSFHATTRPTIPFPFRKDKSDVLYVNSSEFSDLLRDEEGTGIYSGLYMTHDIFMNGTEVSPLTHQLKFLCRIFMKGQIDLRDDEIIYNSVNEVWFEYYCPLDDGCVLSHERMMQIVEMTKETHGDTKFKEVTEYFEELDKNLQPVLEQIFIGKYPRELWGKLDMISASKNADQIMALRAD